MLQTLINICCKQNRVLIFERFNDVLWMVESVNESIYEGINKKKK